MSIPIDVLRHACRLSLKEGLVITGSNANAIDDKGYVENWADNLLRGVEPTDNEQDSW